MTFTEATYADLDRICEIIRQAQAQMRALGSRQWQDGYPAPANIEEDIARGYGYVLRKSEGESKGRSEGGDPDAGRVIAYGAVIFDGEPAYEALDGKWLTDRQYVVLHRMAVADGEKGRGVAREFMCRTEALARERGIGSFRVDTNFDNRYMLRLLDGLGFVYCGRIVYASGERLAFEKRI